MPQPVDVSGPVMCLSGVGYVYPGPPPLHALSDVDLAIDKGEYIAIVGPSGSGKSTLLNLMGLLDRPSVGELSLHGVDVSSISEGKRSSFRAQHIGFVFQDFHLLSYRSAIENVMLAQLYLGIPSRIRRNMARTALEQVGLDARAMALAVELSGGERQRVAIARAIANSPSLLLCDEPTGNLDSRTANTVMSVLDGLHRSGLTIVVITHNERVAERADRSITVSDGRISKS